MADWILILLVYAGPLASGDGVTLTTAKFENKTACEAAGQQAGALVRGSAKVLRYVCVQDR